jgi:dipeptidyl aminopeptidase/acylaminoacyl peptidase
MNANGSGLFNLTNDPGYDHSDAWSPDGRKIAFVSDRQGNSEIFVMTADGSGSATNLTNNPGSDRFPHWSPDGTHIAFMTDRDGHTEIYVMLANGTQQTRLIYDDQPKGYFAWSPDGRRIAYVARSEDHYDLYVVNSDGSGLTRLTGSPEDEDFPDWMISAPDCSAGWTRLSVGSRAVVTPGDFPNRVRSEPEVGDNITQMLYPGAIIKILEGPVCVDDLVFWKVENAAIPGSVGWTAEGDGKEYWLAPYTP